MGWKQAWRAVAAVALGAMAASGCQRAPQRVFAVQIASSAETPAPVAQRAPDAGPDADDLHARHLQLDLNRASVRALREVPGLDTATAQTLVAARPYADKRDLLRRNLITDAQYEQWKDYFVVHRDGRR